MNIFRALWEAFCETAKEEFTVTEQDRQRLAAQRQIARKRQNEEEDLLATSNQYSLDSHSLYALDSRTLYNPNNCHYED